MREFLLNVYSMVFNFLSVDLALSPGLSKFMAVFAVIAVVVLAVKLAMGILRWIGIRV